MSERRRISRARATATPEREVQRGVPARLRWDGVGGVDVAAMLRDRAVARTGRVLVAWLIGRWRR